MAEKRIVSTLGRHQWLVQQTAGQETQGSGGHEYLGVVIVIFIAAAVRVLLGLEGLLTQSCRQVGLAEAPAVPPRPQLYLLLQVRQHLLHFGNRVPFLRRCRGHVEAVRLSAEHTFTASPGRYLHNPRSGVRRSKLVSIPDAWRPFSGSGQRGQRARAGPWRSRSVGCVA